MIWFDGRLVESAQVSALTHSLHYGGAVFEGIRFYESEGRRVVFRLRDHAKRLLHSAQAMHVWHPYSEEAVVQAIIQTVQASGTLEGYIRPIMFLGEGFGLCAEDLQSHFAVYVFPAPKPSSPLTLKLSRLIRMHPKSTNLEAKVAGHYANSSQAAWAAKAMQANDALMLDYQGNVAETSVANVFFVKGGRLFTPRKRNIFPGLTRDTVLRICDLLSLKVTERKVSLSEALQADEMFVCGTACGVLPVGELEGVKFESKVIALKIQELYETVVRGQHNNWIQNQLTYIERT